ncbi:MAG: hypothetical protein KatS3mg102_2393 [Planctomycetota bacterium]|nr:MAG: hypothetical protein KatS3mg102_2393 [Planctomycetota bacterium]
MTTTPSMEDYLERIYKLVQKKGYARVVDIAELLDFKPSSVTRMVQRLADEGFLEYERYRGIVLTEKGRQLGRVMERRHESLDEFLRLIGVQDEQALWQDVEGIEHHVSPETMAAIRSLVAFFKQHPSCYRELCEFQRAQGLRGAAGPGQGQGQDGAAMPAGGGQRSAAAADPEAE